ncbi:PEP-CTERM sorting domain-containing protein [Noviherbaspirillum sp. 1P10PC]|uniref:PEP-CTERM sorting domain-containing protein n=1 Tax=Noviherbaspirillum sp. 1P10PC TaxID=3132292 RepID=UPI00399FE7D9
MIAALTTFVAFSIKGANVKKMIKALAATAVAGCMFAAPAANAITFTITGGSFAAENGYGTGNNDLDVTFSTAGYWNTSKVFNLTTVNQQTSLFNFGLITLREDNISQSETGSLGITATFNFTNPFATSTPLTVTTSGVIAYTGPVNDCFLCIFNPDAVDYKIDWAPSTVDFGAGGKFRIDMTDLSFNQQESLTQTARLTLLALPSEGGNGNAVPEPTTVALLGLGLLGFAASRRKAAKK